MINRKLLILFALVLFSAYSVHQAERNVAAGRIEARNLVEEPKNGSKPVQPDREMFSNHADTLRAPNQKKEMLDFKRGAE
jgi:hypothetical protein